MHFDKFKQGSVNGILRHNDRGIYTPDNVEHSNTNIDKSRTALNYSLLSDSEPSYIRHKNKLQEIEKITKERTGKGLRKDAVTMCSWVLTAPQDLPEEKHEEFFKYSYEFLCSRYGKENVISATVHNDETTPHLHFTFIPIVEDEKGNKKLCAKNLETPNSLRSAHKSLQDYLETNMKCPVNVLNGATKGGNKTKEEFQSERLHAENGLLRESNAELRNNALEYECTPKKLLESKEAYENRTNTYKQAVAVKQTRSELDKREQNLNAEIEIKAYNRARQMAQQMAQKIVSDRENALMQDNIRKDEVIRTQQQTIETQRQQLEYYKKYDDEIEKIKKKRKNSALAEAARGSIYTLSNDETYDHSLKY